MHRIHHVESVAEVFEAIRGTPPGTFLVLDIDETVLRSPAHLGSEAWYDEIIEEKIRLGLSEDAAATAGYEEWEKVHQSLDCVLAENNLDRRITDWMRDRPAMGLTARRPDFADRTQEQLRRLGIRLPHILYVGPLGHKGLALETYLKGVSPKPPHVAFVDDRPEHVQTVDLALRSLGLASDCFLLTR